MVKGSDYVKWFSELSNKDVPIAGGKGASLAEMYNNKFPIPPGFVITAQAYSYFIEKSEIAAKIKEIIDGLDMENTKALQIGSRKIRDIIENTEMPADLEQEIKESYEILNVNKDQMANAKGKALDILRKAQEPPFVAVRSSATTEDLADASFAGQQESFLNVKGSTELIKNVKMCFSSLFTARAIYYRTKKGFDHSKSYLAVVVQMMINSDKSGVMFSRNPVNNKEEILIEAVWGLGEGIVSGMINPDHYVVDRNLEKLNVKEIKLGEKKVAVTRDASGKNYIVKLVEERSKQQVLNNYELKMLSSYALQLEDHYKKPQDIEFAISGQDIYIVQSRPITTKFADSDKKDLAGEILLNGLGASPGVASGTVKIVHSIEELGKVKKGDVLVTEMTNPDMVVSMQRAAAIVTDEGGVTSHAAIVSREMGIPCVVGTEEATKKLKEGEVITVDGNNGKVYEGKGEKKEVVIDKIVPTKTKIKVIVDLPEYAERAAKSGSKFVGLVRLEGIIGLSGKHPMYFVKQKKIDEYSKVIASGLKKIAEHFEEIWVRTSDIRSDEFRHLEGAPQEQEMNPMLGNHGIRYSLKHKDILDGELKAFKIIASEFPNKKFGIMVPQVISLDELKATKEHAKSIGMPENVKVGIMVETPAAVQIINQLCEDGLDFISFGTNDLTQYMLAIDRNNEHVQDLYNEMNPAVLSALSYVIRRCRRYGVETSICGQAGSREDMVRFLLGEGIDSVSVNADAAHKVSLLISSLESEGISAPQESVSSIPIAVGKDVKEESPIVIKEGEKIAVPIVVGDMAKQDKDIEDVILKELESDEYSPGMKDGKNDIPTLNDAIPVDSNDFVEE